MSCRSKHVNLLRLVRVAYQVPNFQIVGSPGWFESERYDIQARATGAVAIDQLQRMIQEMLAERFGLRVLRDRRAVDGYELRVERSGSTGLAASARPCAVAQADQPRVTGNLPPCFRAIAGEVTARGVTMAMAAQQLQGYVGQPVVDATGLAGTYDFDLRWNSELGRPETARGGDAPSLFTAVREQLGLRLVAAKPTVDVLIIAAAHRPDAN